MTTSRTARREHGARPLREGGRHSYWGFDPERSTALPRYREIAWPLARKICKQLGISPGGVARSHVCDVELTDCSVILDFDAADKLIGIELLGASRLLPVGALDE